MATIKASSEQTQSDFALQEHVYAPGLEPPLHLHREQDEAFYVLEGAMTVWCGDQTWSVSAVLVNVVFNAIVFREKR